MLEKYLQKKYKPEQKKRKSSKQQTQKEMYEVVLSKVSLDLTMSSQLGSN